MVRSWTVSFRESNSDRQFSRPHGQRTTESLAFQIWFPLIYFSFFCTRHSTAREKLTNQTAAALAPGHQWCKFAVTRPSLAKLLVATAADSCSSTLSFEGNFKISCSLFTAAGGTRLRVRRSVFKKLSREQRVAARAKPLIWTRFPGRVQVWSDTRCRRKNAVVVFGKTSWCHKWKFVPQLFTCVS